MLYIYLNAALIYKRSFSQNRWRYSENDVTQMVICWYNSITFQSLWRGLWKFLFTGVNMLLRIVVWSVDSRRVVNCTYTLYIFHEPERCTNKNRGPRCRKLKIYPLSTRTAPYQYFTHARSWDVAHGKLHVAPMYFINLTISLRANYYKITFQFWHILIC